MAYRPARLALKARAGAELGILNLCGDIADVARFTAAVAATDAPVPVMVSVPVITSGSAARRLGALPGVALPPGIEEAVTAAEDGVDAGIEAAVAWALRALAVPGIVGVHLSAVVDEGDPIGLCAVDALVRTAELLRESHDAASAGSDTGAMPTGTAA